MTSKSTGRKCLSYKTMDIAHEDYYCLFFLRYMARFVVCIGKSHSRNPGNITITQYFITNGNTCYMLLTTETHSLLYIFAVVIITFTCISSKSFGYVSSYDNIMGEKQRGKGVICGCFGLGGLQFRETYTNRYIHYISII